MVRKHTFIEVLNNPKGRKIIESIEEIDEELSRNPKDKILPPIRKRLVRDLKRKFNYTYRD